MLEVDTQYLLELPQSQMQQDEERKREAFHQALLASGLVKQIKKPLSYQLSARRLVQVQGKSVSETIIEERR